MFNKYWRNYPWFLQLYLFILMIFIVGSLVFYGGSVLVYNATGIGSEEALKLSEQSSPAARTTFLLIQLLNQFGVFLIPPILFAYVTHPKPGKFLGIRKPGKNAQWLLVIVLMLGAIPVEMGIAALIQNIPMPESMQGSQEEYEGMMKGVMNMRNPSDLMLTLLVMSVMPALGEELLFRGVMMRFAAKRFKTMLWPIIITSVIFALAHTGNVTGMLSIFFAGVVLAVIYYLTGSLLLAMLAHFVNNATQVLILYMGRNNEEMKTMAEGNEISWQLVMAGLMVFGVALYALWKQRTPLQAKWHRDFTEEEIAVMDDRKRRRLGL